jgi:hypothetical protein
MALLGCWDHLGKETIMKLFTIAVCGCIAFMTLATNSNAYNYIFLRGEGMGGEMMCSDLTNESDRVAVMQWIFGFITGYDAAIRPNPSEGGLNGQPLADLIVDTCKKNQKADLVSVAKYIATYIQREISGEVSQPIKLRGFGEQAR